MKWRPGRQYNAQYVVNRICRELGADPEDVWNVMDEEFDLEYGGTMSSEDAAYVAEIIEAALPSPAVEVTQKDSEELLTREEAARALKISVNKLDEERRAGRLAYIQYSSNGRVWIPRKAIADYLTKNTHQVIPQRCLRETYRKRRVS